MFDWLFGTPEVRRSRDFTYDVGDTLHTLSYEYVAATLRWAEHNRQARAEGCRYCGRSGTRVTFDDHNTGAVPVEWWTCDEHEGTDG